MSIPSIISEDPICLGVPSLDVGEFERIANALLV